MEWYKVVLLIIGGIVVLRYGGSFLLGSFMYMFRRQRTAAMYIRRSLIEYGLKSEIAYAIPPGFYDDMAELVCMSLYSSPGHSKSDRLISGCQGTAMNIISTIQRDPENSCEYVVNAFNKHGIEI